MTTPYFTSVLSSKSLDQQYLPSPGRGRPRGSLKRGRKPRTADASGTLPTSSSLPIPNIPSISTSSNQQPVPTLDLAGLLSLNPTPVYRLPIPSTNRTGHALDGDGEGEDELLPAMADDDYSAQLSWQGQSKDKLK